MVRALSQSELKLVASLNRKKQREAHGLFVAEGAKVVKEISGFFELSLLIVSSEMLLNTLNVPDKSKVRIADARTFDRISSLECSRDAIAVYRIPPAVLPSEDLQGIAVALDAIQNPGNMGTIIRLCDWLGIPHLICGNGCVDIYNNKVIQATAGALGSVKVHEGVDLLDFLPRHFDKIIGTKMEGLPIKSAPVTNPKERVCILFGNEGHGISEALSRVCTDFYTIPPAPTTTTESLNVGISAAIILSKISGLTV